MNPQLAAFIQQHMWLTDDEITAILKEPMALEALLDFAVEILPSLPTQSAPPRSA